MAHALIDGKSPMLAEVHDLLLQWGLTVGHLPEEATARGRASRNECDVVVFLADDSQEDSGFTGGHLKSVPASDDRFPDAGEIPAPLLVIGQGRLADAMSRNAYRFIPEVGPDGCHLKRALENCLEIRSPGGSSAVDRSDRDQQLHFLGHELRSPLTAIKTALEVVQGDLGGVSGQCSPTKEPASDQAGLRMLEIALRNVRRMHHAVEWSQSLLSFEESRPSLVKRKISLGGLVAELGQVTGSIVQMRGRDLTMNCDADLLLSVVEQAIEAVRFGNPDRELTLHLDAETAGPHRVLIEILSPGSSWNPEETEQESTPCREPNDSDSREAILHLQRFADFLNPSGSLLRANGEVRVCSGQDKGVGLAVSIEYEPATSSLLTVVG